jgi:hypothetical protein
MSQNTIPQQTELLAALLICERLFHIYCRYSDVETAELRELLDELWSVDLIQEEYTEADVAGVQSFLSSLYQRSRTGNHYVAAGFLVSLIDVYDYLVAGGVGYVESIRQQGIDSIRHHLEHSLFADDAPARELTKKERLDVEGSVLLKQEHASQSSADIDLRRDYRLVEIKHKYIYDPILMPDKLART